MSSSSSSITNSNSSIPLAFTPSAAASSSQTQSKITIQVSEATRSRIQSLLAHDIGNLKQSQERSLLKLALTTKDQDEKHTAYQTALEAHKVALENLTRAESNYKLSNTLHAQCLSEHADLTNTIQQIEKDLENLSQPASAFHHSAPQQDTDVVMQEVPEALNTLAAVASSAKKSPTPPSRAQSSKDVEMEDALSAQKRSASLLDLDSDDDVILSPVASKRARTEEKTIPAALIQEIFQKDLPLYFMSNEAKVVFCSKHELTIQILRSKEEKTLPLTNLQHIFFKPTIGETYLVREAVTRDSKKGYHDAKILEAPIPLSQMFKLTVEWSDIKNKAPCPRKLSSWDELLPFSSKDPRIEKLTTMQIMQLKDEDFSQRERYELNSEY